MKIVKYIFLLLILATIALTVFVATQEGKYNIKKDKVINVSRPVLYHYLNDYRNWENLGLFASADTTANFSYSENTSGTGAYMAWTKDSDGGKIQTQKVAVNDSIVQKATLDNLDANVAWAFKDTLKSTKVTVRLSGKLTFTEKAYAFFNGGVDNAVESSLEKGLVNLNNFLVKEIQKYSIEVVGVVNKKGAFYLGTTATLPLADVSRKAITSFDKLTAFAKENKIVLAGKPFIIYKVIDNNAKTTKCTFSIPIRDEIFTAPGSDYEGGKLLPFNALKTTLRGDYSHLSKAWEAARKHMREKALPENTTAQYLEIYTKSGAQTRRPSMLITDVYIPVGTPQVTEKDSVIPARTTLPYGTTPARAAAGSGAGKPSATNTVNSKPTAKPANSDNPAKSAANTATKPAATVKPAAAQAKSATTTKPATNTAQPKPAATAKPATNTTKQSTTNKQSTTTPVKPATTITTPAKPKPANSTAKPGADDLNPPRA